MITSYVGGHSVKIFGNGTFNPSDRKYHITPGQEPIIVIPYSGSGMDTSKLLTVGAPVADEEGRVIGCLNLNHN